MKGLGAQEGTGTPRREGNQEKIKQMVPQGITKITAHG